MLYIVENSSSEHVSKNESKKSQKTVEEIVSPKAVIEAKSVVEITTEEAHIKKEDKCENKLEEKNEEKDKKNDEEKLEEKLEKELEEKPEETPEVKTEEKERSESSSVEDIVIDFNEHFHYDVVVQPDCETNEEQVKV